MYAAPPVIQTEVFATLPKVLHNTGVEKASETNETADERR